MAEWLDPHVERFLLLSEQEYIVLQVHKHWMASIGAWARRMYDMGSLPLRAGHGEFYRDVPPGAFVGGVPIRMIRPATVEHRT